MIEYDPTKDPKYGTDSASNKKPEECDVVYCIRGKSTRQCGGLMWWYVPKGTYVRHDGPSATGTKSDVVLQIANHENVDPACIVTAHNQSYPGMEYHWNEPGLALSLTKLSSLEEMMEYVRASGETIIASFHMYRNYIAEGADEDDVDKNPSVSIKSFSRVIAKKRIVSIGHGYLIVDRKWIFYSGTLRYDPDRAEELLAARELEKKTKAEKIREMPPGRRPINGPKPSHQMVSLLFNSVRDSVFNLRPYFDSIPEKRGWRDTLWLRNWPTTTGGAMWGVVTLALMYKKLAGTNDYRKKGSWADSLAKFVASEWHKTPEGDFRNFIRKEAKAAKLKLPKPDPKGKKKENKIPKDVPALAGDPARSNP